MAKSSLTSRAELDQYNQLWYLAKKGKGLNRALSQAITRAATSREIANIPTRWRNLTFYREMTGRPTLSQFIYGMAKRPSNFVDYYRQWTFSGVKSGFAATMADVYTNRLLGHQTFVSMIPTKGDAEQTAVAQEIENGIEISDDQLSYQRERFTMCTETFWYGAAAMAFDDDGDGNPVIRAVNPDELLYSNVDDPDPYDVIWRQWVKKTELLEQKGIKGNAEAENAVLRAPSAEAAFYFGRGALDCTDVVPLLRGWTRPLPGQPGRYVRVIGDYCLDDKEWKYPHPFEWWQFNPLPGSIMLGQGIAELLLQISQWIDGLLSTAQDSDIRSGTGKWLVDENSNVNPDSLGSLNAAVCTYLGKEPRFVTPDPIGQYFLLHLKALLDLGRSRVHVSEAASKGEIPAGITAAIAIEKFAQIDDQNFLEKIGRLEDFDKRAAYQKIMLFKRLGTKFKTGRREFDWSKIKLNRNFRINDLQAYNVGRLSQTVAGRIQIVEQMRANGRIDDKTYNKFLQTPDIPGMFADVNAETNDIDAQLDALAKSDDYIPPTPFMDFLYAKKKVETRMAREEADQIIAFGKVQDQAILDRFSMWRATVMSFLNQQQTPDGPPSPAAGAMPPALPAPSGGFGIEGAAPVVPAEPLAPPVAPVMPALQTSAVPQ